MQSKFNDLNLKSLIIHWGSKLLPVITGRSKVDRLSVVVTVSNVEQLLGVPQLGSDSKYKITTAIHDTLEERSLLEKM